MSEKYLDETWQNSMKVKFDYNNMLQQFFSNGEGITLDDIKKIEPQIKNAIYQMKIKREEGKMDWRDLPYNQENIVKDIEEYVLKVKDNFEAFVVFGIGGSALGPLSVQQAINHPFYNELSRQQRNNFPKFYVVDNIDPEKLVYLFDTIDITKTLFNVISKSGSTSETMSQFMIIKEMLEKKLGKDIAKNHIVCTTDKENGNLIKIAKEENYKTFIIPDGVGGRFSELTPVGLLPAAFTGIDIKQMLKGASFMDKICENEDIFKNPAFMYAILNYIAYKKGKNICVLMPYADRLKFISDWYAQLWAESLGKKFDLDNKEIYVGMTPVKSLGVTDQHSQVQLYTEGPFDKVIVFMTVENYKETLEIPKIYQDISSLGFLGGITQNKLIQTEQMATEYALLKSGKMNMTITLPEVNEFTLGEILYLFEVSTGFAGELLHIDAFNQPGVEEGKNATYAMFGRPGYENKKQELDSRPKKDEKFII